MNVRKASLRKLRLPGGSANKSRNGHQKNAATISNYFSCEDNSQDAPNTAEMTVYSVPTPSPIIGINDESAIPEEASFSSKENHEQSENNVESIPMEEDQAESKSKRALRTKLSTFLPKDKRLGKRKSHDFETPNKNIKKAPKIKRKQASKKQQNIKSAFLKHEEIFSEVTAQHCLADNVNPDEMQMAIAISRSEAEISMSVVEREEDECKTVEGREAIRDKLKQFGFRVAGSEDYTLTAFMPTRTKTKWANKFTALTLRNPQRQLDKVNQKIEHLLSSQFASEEFLPVDNTARYNVKSRALRKFLANDQHVVRLDVSEMSNLVDFYVLSLFEPSRTRVGHLLKDVRLIAGRDETPKKLPITSMSNENDNLFQSPVQKKSRCGEYISSSCATSNGNLIDIFEDACEDTNTIGTGIQTLTEVTSISLNAVENKGNHQDDGEIASKTDRKNNSLSVFTEITETLSSDGPILSSPIRCTSPDIFADSDSEIATDEWRISEAKLNASKSSPSDHHITTYEAFSSDEVKTFSIIRNNSNISNPPTPLIDLTQCGSDSSSQPSQKEVQTTEGNKENNSENVYTALTLSSNLDEGEEIHVNPSNHIDQSNQLNGHQSFEKSIGEKLGGFSFGSSVSEDFNKSDSTKQVVSEISIDLTQNDDEEDDCILLSDDEVNYSMWQAKEPQNDESHWNSESVDNLSFPKDIAECEKKEFSIIEFVAGSQPLPATQSDEFEKGHKSNSSLDLEMHLSRNNSKQFDFGEEPPQFKTPTKTPKKTPNTTPKSTSPRCRKTLTDYFKSSPTGRSSKHSSSSNSLNDISELDLDLSKRSDFGILDEQSPFKTPTRTPKKSAKKTPGSAKCRRTLSESFILSPGDKEPPIKRYSSVTKFKEFAACDDNDDNLSDLDEIDKLIYGSPSKKAYKKPAGLDQLLTGPINVQIDSPKKPEPDSPKEFIFNGRTYLVRTSNVSEMLDYETLNEPSLLNELYKYGIRRLKRKQAVKVLEYIYKQTHPCLIEPTESPAKSTQVTTQDEDPVSEDGFSQLQTNSNTSSGFKFNLQDCWGHLMISNSDVQTEIKDEQYILQTNTNKKISTALLPFHIAWYNLVKSNKLLHEAILHYEPIDLQEIFAFFKELGYRYDPKEMKYFFDSRSIIFRYEPNKTDPSAGTNRHRRKKPQKTTQRKGRIKIS